jgi:tyrosyl-tRNA synthetase
LRVLQNKIANEITFLVHSKDDLDKAKKASQILFGKSTSEELKSLDMATFLDVFEGVPQGEISRSKLESGIDIIAALAGESSFLKSNGEARRALKENSISINKIKVNDEYSITNKDLINDRYVLLQRGKKTYFILKFV